ncbi:MAG: MDR family MFS transporter [Myxococcales bacterium]
MKSTHRTLTVSALLVTMFVAALEITVVSTAMPTVIAELGGIHVYTWVFTAYMLASTVSVPIYGKLADLYGRKPVLLWGIVLFLLGSMASGAAGSMTQLIIARTVQGLGTGSMQPMTMTIAGDLYTPRERARVQGLFGSVWGFAGLVGPLLGGLIVGALSWRWVFYVNVPFGILAILLLSTALHEKVERHSHTLDFVGALLLPAAIVGLLLGQSLPWFVVSLLLLVLFLWNEGQVAEPILPLGLFRTRLMAIASIGGAVLGAVMTAVTTFVPLFVQGVLGGSPSESGIAIAPVAIGWPVASAVSARLLVRVGYSPLVRIGFFLTSLASSLLAWTASRHPTLTTWYLISFLLGLGLGAANTTLIIAVQGAVGWRQRGVATASTLLFRALGGAIGVGLLGGVLASSLAREASLPADAARKLFGRGPGAGLDREAAQSLAHALEAGLSTVFWMLAAVALCGFVVSMFFPRMKLEPESP